MESNISAILTALFFLCLIGCKKTGNHKDEAFLIVDAAALEQITDSKAVTVTVPVKSNVAYTATASANWISITGKSNTALTMQLQENKGSDIREGTIVLSGEGVSPVTIKIKQGGVAPPVITNEWAGNPYKLNVIYFIPTDIDSVPRFRARLSKILLEGQKFYADNLQREGFGRRSFGLDLVTDDLVNIVVIMGKKDKSAYPYTGGGSVVQGEVDAYFNANPGKKKSDHYLVILPSTSGDPLNPGGVPFYGTGRYCYALDYETMEQKYLGQTGTNGTLATKWIGGLLHELGHGLNGPHNWGTKTSVAAYGTALMGSGNLTYGKQPTFITKTSAAIFANGQTFSKQTRADWYQNFTFLLNKLSSGLEDGKMILSDKFIAEKPITHVLAYFDRTPYGGNQDYDVISFGEATINGDSIYIVCPLSEFQNLTDEYQLRLHFLAENGVRKTESFIFSFENGVPVLTNVLRTGLSDRTAWTATSSGNQSSSPPANLLDGDPGSNWHTPWNPKVKKPPHWFSIDTKANTSFNTLVLYNRSNLAGALKDFYLKTSNDGINWTMTGTYNIPQNAGVNYVLLPGTITARYVQIESVSMYGGDGYTHLAEFDLFLR